jgi:hypothetical protein
VLPASPDLAAWLACSPAGDLEDGALAGAASAYRRLAAWAQGGELAVVAQMASRAAAAQKNGTGGYGVSGEVSGRDGTGQEDGTGQDGRPGQVPADAYGQVSLALTLSRSGAEWWTNLAVDLQWRLAATGTALREGTIDLSRARAIAEATAPLDDDKARAVEARILPRAGQQTTGQLRASLRRAVITADPEGAERRREEAERRARVILYPDAEGTASLSGQSLPGIRAAAAMARITALARALKATGAGGGIDLLRSKVFLGLLLGTLPHIPPPPNGPPDSPADPGPGCPPHTGPADSPPAEDEAGSPHLDDWPWHNDPADHAPATGQGRAADQDSATDDDAVVDENLPIGGEWPRDDGLPGDRGLAEDADDPACGDSVAGPVPWPEATPILPPAPAALKNLQPADSGFLELRLPLRTLTNGGPEPGYLTRLGPITPAQASYLALLATADPAVEWRVVLTNNTGQAIAVTRVKPGRSRAGPPRAGPGDTGSLLRRVTVIMTTDQLGAADPGRQCADDNLAAVHAAIINAARQAAGQAASRAAADNTAGGCAHTQASPAYQAPARLREFINLRDLTCRFPTCRQPAWQCDADHTRPFDQDGPTCSCNLGPLCRYHHQLKQHPLWRLEQPAPGSFLWTTPTGRTYTVQPDSQAA